MTDQQTRVLNALHCAHTSSSEAARWLAVAIDALDGVEQNVGGWTDTIEVALRACNSAADAALDVASDVRHDWPTQGGDEEVESNAQPE